MHCGDRLRAEAGRVDRRGRERGVFVDHATVHRWAIKILPVLGAVFRRPKRPVGASWRLDETYIKVGGEWKPVPGRRPRRPHDRLPAAGASRPCCGTALPGTSHRSPRHARQDHHRQERRQHGCHTERSGRLRAQTSSCARESSSTTSLNRITGWSSGSCDSCWDSSPSTVPTSSSRASRRFT